ncbi:MAG: SpoIIE family protein phosphatase [Planctomycetota bacterium]
MLLLSKISARILAPALLVGPALVISTLLIIGATRQSAKISEDLGATAMAETQRRIGERIGGLLECPHRLVDLNVRLATRGDLAVYTPAELLPAFLDQSLAFDQLSAVSWGSERTGSAWVARYTGEDGLRWALQDRDTGDMILYALSPDGVVSAEPVERFAYELSERTWYAEPMASGRAAWTRPYVWGGSDDGPKTLGIGFNAPVFDENGRAFGVLNADLSLSNVSKFLATVEAPEGTAIFVMDDEGTLVATSLGPVASGDATLKASASPEPIVSIASAIAEDVVGPTVVQRHVVVEGERYWVDASGMTAEGGLEWVIVTAMPESALLGAVDRARAENLRRAGIAVLVTVLVGMVLGMLVVRPLLAMRKHASRIGEGDFESRVNFGVTPELRGLGEAMNEMALHLKERYEIRRSLELASEVQRALLPETPPQPKGLELAGLSRYCDETGGDYYDFLEVVGVSEEATVIVVGDVMGHGIAAAMLMATARGMLRSHAVTSGSLASLLTHVNSLLSVDTGGRRFMTMQLIEIEPVRRSLRWASAGHGPPLIYDPVKDEFIDTDGGGLPLGLDEEETYEEVTISELAVGTVLISATDGVWEAKAPSGEQFGLERVKDVIREHHAGGADAISKAINAAVHAHMGDEPADDDVTLVVARIVDPGDAEDG